jgi:hypothetical protein
VNEDLLGEMGWNGMMDSDEVYASSGYMDPNNFSSNVCVKVSAAAFSGQVEIFRVKTI